MSGLDRLLHELPEPLRPDLAHYWEAWQAAASVAGVEWSPGAEPEALAKVWACSEFVARACIREPALLAGLWASGDLKAVYAPGDLAARLEGLLAGATDDGQLALALRRFRRREMVRIAWRDLAGWAALTETLGDLTDLADTAVSAALQRLHTWQSQRYGTPRDAEGQATRRIAAAQGRAREFRRPRLRRYRACVEAGGGRGAGAGSRAGLLRAGGQSG